MRGDWHQATRAFAIHVEGARELGERDAVIEEGAEEGGSHPRVPGWWEGWVQWRGE
jgi:hypothetical protein